MTQTIDTETETMPDPWHVARLLRAQGREWSQIATETGITINALRCKASRQQWGKAISRAKDIVRRDATQAIQSGVRDAVESAQVTIRAAAAEVTSDAQEYIGRAKGIIRRAVDHLDNLSQGDITLDDMEKLARSIKLIDDVGRRTHNLDQDSGRQMVGLRQTINIIQAPSNGPAIDV